MEQEILKDKIRGCLIAGATDYMIRMLPEGFFFDIVIRIGGTFILLLAVSLTGSVIISKTYKKNEIY